METAVFDRLNQEIDKRQWSEGQEEIIRMADLYEGKLPSEYDKYFPQGEPRQVVNLVRLAWDDLATSIGRLPDLQGEPNNLSDAEAKRVGLLERIGHAYLRDSEPSGKLLLWQLAWWLIGTGRAVCIVKPNTDKRKPQLSLRDPRTMYPAAKTSMGSSILELDNIIFRYDLPKDEMEARGLSTHRAGDGYDERGSRVHEQKTGTVIEYIDDKTWIVASDGGSVIKEDHNLGVVPAFVFQSFAPNKPGLSQFSDQVSFAVAISRMLSQKLAFVDKQVYPVYWVRGHEGSLKIGPNVINKLGPQGEMGLLAPPTTLQVDRDIALLQSFSRILNRNPEVRQGEVSAKGSYTSAKTLEQLSEAIDTVIGRGWDILSVGLQHLLKVCFIMDEKYWPNTEKSISGVLKGSTFRDMYTPSKDIAGRNYLRVDYGFGLGGYQGFLQHLQAKDAQTMSRRKAMEAMPGVSDVDAELRMIELERMDEAGALAFENLAAQGQLDMLLWSKLRKEMARKGKPLFEVIEKYQEDIQAQAEAATQQGGAEALTAAQGPAPEEAQGPPGIPSSVLVGG